MTEKNTPLLTSASTRSSNISQHQRENANERKGHAHKVDDLKPYPQENERKDHHGDNGEAVQQLPGKRREKREMSHGKDYF